MNFSFLSTLLCRVSVLLRLYPSNPASISIIRSQAMDNIRFTNPHPTVNSIDLMGSYKTGDISPLPCPWACKESCCVLAILLFSGDVELNPGPIASNYKYPCTVCNMPVKNNQQGLSCDTCEKWSHATCCNSDKDRYQV